MTSLALDHLRPPAPTAADAAAYKEWLHLVVAHHDSGAVGLVNVSLHGAPAARSSRAVGTALVAVPGAGWVGGVTAYDQGVAVAGGLSLAVPGVALGVDVRSGALVAAVDLPGDDVHGRLRGEAVGPAVLVDRVEAGGRWVGWWALPRVRLTGTLQADGATLPLAGASGYADHNWGRWHWGDGFGWEWGVFLAPPDRPDPVTVVLSRATDRAGRPGGRTLLEVRAGGTARRFTGDAVRLTWGPATLRPVRRLPGAAAVLHGDRAGSRQPAALQVRAGDGHDEVVLDFTARSVAQVILADPGVRGYGLLHEIVGDFRAALRLRGRSTTATGLAVVERAG